MSPAIASGSTPTPIVRRKAPSVRRSLTAFLTLSLIAPFLEELFVVQGASGQINYGFNKVRFPSPVPAGSRLHARGELKAVEARDASADDVLPLSIWVDDADVPACAAELVIRLFS